MNYQATFSSRPRLALLGLAAVAMAAAWLTGLQADHAGLLLATGAVGLDLSAVLKALDKIEPKLQQLPELADRLFFLEQKHNTPAPGGTGHPAMRTAGAEFAAKLAENRDLFDKTGRFSIGVETKGMITAVQVGARGSLGPTSGPQATETMLSAVLPMPVVAGLQSIVYPRRTIDVPEGSGAAVQAGEGAAKQESTPVYASITQNQATVAAFANVSEQALRSSAELQAAIDLHLRLDVLNATDRLLMNGTTVAGSTFAGLLTLAPARAFVDPNIDELEKLIAVAAMAMRAKGYAPDIVVVNPADWQLVIIHCGSDNHYINGSPFNMPPLNIAGLRVAFSAYVDQQKALLIDSRYVAGQVSDQMRVEAGHVNDQFTKNMVTLRAEMGVIPVVRDSHALMYVRKTV